MRSLFLIAVLVSLSTGVSAQDDASQSGAGAANDSDDTRDKVSSLREILSNTPDDGSAHYQLGILLMENSRDLDGAILHFDRAVDLGFQPLGSAYRLSRIYARRGEDSDAFRQLEVLSAGGFGLIGLIDDEIDYDNIRNEGRFVAIVTDIRANRYPCETDLRHHDFDFWIGRWNVTQNDQFAGTNSIQAMLGHCVLYEQWEGAGGSLGKSFNYFDPAQNHWRQIWISDSGTIIEFTGEARDGGLYFTAETVSPQDGAVTLHKFQFTKLNNGAVRQYWETSTDAGESWQAIWDGKYEAIIDPEN